MKKDLGIVPAVYPMPVLMVAAYHATDLCISCGRCAAVCPLHNITIDKPSPDAPAPRPAWHGQCNHCEACYHHCPTNAIQYGKATKGKGQYHHPTQQQ